MVKKMAKRHRVRRYYARAKHHARKMTIPIAPIVGIAAAPGTAYTIQKAMTGNVTATLKAAGSFIGLDDNGVFQMNILKNNLVPILIGAAVHKFVGGTLGVNRMLGAAKVPILRL